MIKARFAPSPTGKLHIGSARTALFNWLYARATGGKYVLRIEDTDLERSKKEYEEEILQSLKWLGLDWDELYYQSQRFDLYKEKAEELIKKDLAYKDGDAVLFKMPKTEIKLYDIIRGEITFDTANFVSWDAEKKDNQDTESLQLKDEVLIKSDGSPVYNFCCVVDDAELGITCVIRGEDHISNTPKQLLLYDALGYKKPKYAHLPLIMGESGGRLSKRTGAVAVSDYKEMGFLSDAIVNYLMLLGWSPGNNQEVISLSNAVKKFSLKKANKTAAIFSMDKLTWINNQYIKNKDIKEVCSLLEAFLSSKNIKLEKETLTQAARIFKTRMPTLSDFIERANFIINEEITIDSVLEEKHSLCDYSQEFSEIINGLQEVDPFTNQSIEANFRKTISSLNKKMSDLVHPIRVALTGSDVGPGLFETMEVLGKQRTIKRLSKYS